MRRIPFLLTFIIVLLANSAFGQLRNKGALDAMKTNFYFTGYSIYYWSGYEKQEFENKLNAIYKYNLKKKEMSIFYDGTCELSDLNLSADERYIGGLCKIPGTIFIFNMSGKKLLELSDQMQEYIWQPNGSKIIYMSGLRKSLGDDIVVESKGVWIYDIATQTKMKIAEKGWDLRTDSSGSYLYFWDGVETIKYHFGSSQKEKTNFKGKVEYSPDGRYYIYYLDEEASESWQAPYWSPFRIFDAKVNEALPPERRRRR